MELWQYIILFGSVICGGWIAFSVQQYNKQFLKLVLSFSGAYILGITVLHLMPSVFYNYKTSISLWILGGFFVQLILDQFSQGVEHGHIHAHRHSSTGFAIQIMLGLSLHAFLEGMPLSSYVDLPHAEVHGHHHGHNHLFYGIVLHKLPAAFALVFLLLSSNFKKSTAWICLIIFAIMSPLGALVSSFLAMNADVSNAIMALVIGSFLHISTTILFETDDTQHHSISWKKLLTIVTGIGLSLLTIF